MKRVFICLSAILAGILAAFPASGVPAFTYNFCRSGQVFLAWEDPEPPDHYRVYRSTSQITEETLGQAEIAADGVVLGSAKDVIESELARRKGQPDPNVGYRLTDLGPTLNPEASLWVYTIHDGGTRYYAVTSVDDSGEECTTIVAGQNSLTEPINEVVATTAPIIDQEGTTSGSHNPYRVYLHWATPEQCQKDGTPFRFSLEWPAQGQSVPMDVALRGYGHVYELPWDTWGRVLLMTSDWHPTLPWPGYDWYYGYAQDYGTTPLQGPVQNYTERRLLWMIEWVAGHFSVDRDRVYLTGFSMGGTGVLSFGLRHPELFAALCAGCPNISPGLPGIGWSQDYLKTLWGPVSSNLPTNEGIGVWTRQDSTEYVRTHTDDLPFIQVNNNRNDLTLLWFQAPPFYRALNEAKQGFHIGWGMNGHSTSTTGYAQAFMDSNLSMIRRNAPYIAISNASTDNNPGNGDPADGDQIGQMGCGFSWEILSDMADRFSFRAKYDYGASTADLTPRRRQAFLPSSSEAVFHTVTDGAGIIVRDGGLTVGSHGMISLEQVALDSNWRTARIYRAGETPLWILGSLGAGTAVVTPPLVITSILTDRFYAELPDRSGAVEVLGTTSAQCDEVVRIFGTTVQSKTIQATEVLRYGAGTTIIPIAARMRDLTDEILRNSLVLVWGRVETSTEDDFTLSDGSGSCLIEGLGSRPKDQFLFVRGICRSSGGARAVYGMEAQPVP